VLAATSTLQFVLGVATDYTNVVNTNFPGRADALAAEIGLRNRRAAGRVMEA